MSADLRLKMHDHRERPLLRMRRYEVCPESKDTKVLNVYNIFNLKKRHCE